MISQIDFSLSHWTAETDVDHRLSTNFIIFLCITSSSKVYCGN